eukprot:scaffold84408_cov33-Tisochrysis_lutea.AAC.1
MPPCTPGNNCTHKRALALAALDSLSCYPCALPRGACKGCRLRDDVRDAVQTKDYNGIKNYKRSIHALKTQNTEREEDRRIGVPETAQSHAHNYEKEAPPPLID